MDKQLSPQGEALREPMNVDIPTEKNDLKKKHTGRPDGGNASQPWCQQFADHRLQRKHGSSTKRHRDRSQRYY
jgi:hypothetical protein